MHRVFASCGNFLLPPPRKNAFLCALGNRLFYALNYLGCAHSKLRAESGYICSMGDKHIGPADNAYVAFFARGKQSLSNSASKTSRRNVVFQSNYNFDKGRLCKENLAVKQLQKKRVNAPSFQSTLGLTGLCSLHRGVPIIITSHN